MPSKTLTRLFMGILTACFSALFLIVTLYSIAYCDSLTNIFYIISQEWHFSNRILEKCDYFLIFSIFGELMSAF